MDKFQKFIKHNLGRAMYVFAYTSTLKKFVISPKDEMIFEDGFIVNKTKKWGMDTTYILDVLVSMNDVVSF